MDCKMKATITDRLAINGLLPGSASETDIMISSDIQEKVHITADEQKKFGIETIQQDGQTFSRIQTDAEKEIILSSAEVDFLKKRIDFLSSKENLTVHMAKTVRKIRDIKPEVQDDERGKSD